MRIDLGIGVAGLLGAVWLFIAVTTAAAAVSDDRIAGPKPPRNLSEFGLFDDLGAQEPAEGVLPYSLKTALFSDHATKLRFVYVPDGKAAEYDPVEAFAFPVGSVLVKTFAYPAGDRLRLIETRLLIRQDSGWKAWAYVWNEGQSDAVLKITGARLPLEVELADGTPLSFEYSVPNKNQCKGCHSLGRELSPIGPKARFLNSSHPYRAGPDNQIAVWTRREILKGAPTPSDAPSAPDWRDQSQPIDARARAWLDINCAHCHRSEGPASNSGLFLDWGQQDKVAFGIGKRPVAAGRGSGGRLFDIDPGNPDGSILLHRVESTEAGVMMPELGRSLADPEAVELLRQWINFLGR